MSSSALSAWASCATSCSRRPPTLLAGEVVRRRVLYELRYVGQSFELAVEQSQSVDPAELREAFAALHMQRYGYRDDASRVELVNVRVSVWGAAPQLRPRGGNADVDNRAGRASDERAPVVIGGAPLDARVLRGELAPATHVSGPALCALGESTLLVAPGWSGHVDEHGTLHLKRQDARA